jgi:predicted dehydrogenase
MKSTKSTLNIGVIGLGEIGQMHCQALAQIEQANLVAVADIDPARLAQVATQSKATAYQDYQALLAHEGLEAVIIATPDHLHKAPCLHAAQAGKHILVEKPIATTEAEAEAILASVEAAAVQLMVGFTVRFFPQYIHAKQTVTNGDLGDLVSIFARRTNLISQSERIKGRTGVLFFLGVHDFDAMRWIVGSEPESIYCESATSVSLAYPVENETFTVIRFKNGVVGCAHIGWFLPKNHAAGFDFKLDVTGSTGILNLDMERQGVVVHSQQGTRYPFMAAPLIAEDKAFVEAILTEQPVPVSGADGLAAMKMVLAALESLESRQPVRL